MSGLDIASAVLIALGGFFCVVGAIGLLRLPDFYARTHAASMTDTLGVIFLLSGLALQAGPTLVTVKLIMVGVLVLITSPTAAHALAKAAYATGVKFEGPGSEDAS